MPVCVCVAYTLTQIGVYATFKVVGHTLLPTSLFKNTKKYNTIQNNFHFLLCECDQGTTEAESFPTNKNKDICRYSEVHLLTVC